jgi:beta-galactosidase
LSFALIGVYFGVDYHPEHWVYPYAGTPDRPESRWERDAQMMVAAGVNAVRMGEFVWGLCEPEEGKFDFEWLWRAMDIMKLANIEVVLAEVRSVDVNAKHLLRAQVFTDLEAWLF